MRSLCWTVVLQQASAKVNGTMQIRQRRSCQQKLRLWDGVIMSTEHLVQTLDEAQVSPSPSAIEAPGVRLHICLSAQMFKGTVESSARHIYRSRPWRFSSLHLDSIELRSITHLFILSLFCVVILYIYSISFSVTTPFHCSGHLVPATSILRRTVHHSDRTPVDAVAFRYARLCDHLQCPLPLEPPFQSVNASSKALNSTVVRCQQPYRPSPTSPLSRSLHHGLSLYIQPTFLIYGQPTNASSKALRRPDAATRDQRFPSSDTLQLTLLCSQRGKQSKPCST